MGICRFIFFHYCQVEVLLDKLLCTGPFGCSRGRAASPERIGYPNIQDNKEMKLRGRTQSQEFKLSPATAGSFFCWTCRPAIVTVQTLLISLLPIPLVSLLLAAGLY